MEKRTYGAPRLVDWVAQIKAGAATVRVHFTGGALTSYGVTPAEYTTASPFIQKVIEQSRYYKEGRIILLRKTEIDEPSKPTKVKKVKPQQPRQQVPEEADSTHEAPATPQPTEALVPKKQEETRSSVEAGTETIVNHTTDENPDEDEQQSETVTDVAEATDGLTKVEVSCLQDAQAYLQEQFNIASYKVRSYDAAQRAASEHGVVFVGAKFDTLKGGDEAEGKTTEAEE